MLGPLTRFSGNFSGNHTILGNIPVDQRDCENSFSSNIFLISRKETFPPRERQTPGGCWLSVASLLHCLAIVVRWAGGSSFSQAFALRAVTELDRLTLYSRDCSYHARLVIVSRRLSPFSYYYLLIRALNTERGILRRAQCVGRETMYLVPYLIFCTIVL